MAGDLIPPPSPAGRPEPDSSDKAPRSDGALWAADAAQRGAPESLPAVAEAPPPERSRPPVEAPFRGRFGFVLGALIGVALAAIGLGVVMASRSDDPATERDGWSAWQPADGDDMTIATQIAQHVGPRYKDGDEQLVLVQPSELEIQDVPLEGVALRTPSGGIEVVEGDGVIYTLNGLGQYGSIQHGTPSVERKLLVQREALELALYTFRYAEDVDMVLALLPPARSDVEKAIAKKQQPPLQAMFFRPEELRDRLHVPLTATIAPRTPRVKDFTAANPEAETVQELTSSNLFGVSFSQGQDAKAYLVLGR